MARRTFFSFHYVPDCWRAWNVRNVGAIGGETNNSGFFDSSVFEAKKRESDAVLKRFLREGLEDTSVTCVLAGTETWSRRWVRYEIARSVIKGNGFLTIDIHGVKDKNGATSTRGADPLSAMGLYKTAKGIFLAEWQNNQWISYADYTLAIPENDLWFSAPTTDNVVPLSKHCLRYDFTAQNGRQDIGGWIETAAGLAGR